MDVKLDLLENSLDFLRESLELYLIADENGTHLSQHSDYQKKIKWKMAFINLVQALELLMKEIILRISPVLVQSDIDDLIKEEKSINFKQCITRIIKFSQVKISNEEITRLNNCAKLRNRFIHYDVSIKSEEIKMKYSTLFALYSRFFEEGIKEKFRVTGISTAQISAIISFSDQYTIFRGEEIRKIDLDQFQQEIHAAQQHPYFIDKNGVVVERIKFGVENSFLRDSGTEGSIIYLFEYCDDCGAKQGEYHLEFCDLEVCPICKGQALSCDCNLKWAQKARPSEAIFLPM